MQRTPTPPYAEDTALAIVARGEARRIALRGLPIGTPRSIARPATTRTPSHGGGEFAARPPPTFAGTLRRPRRAVDPHATTISHRGHTPRRPSTPTFEHRAHPSTPFRHTSTASRAGHSRRGAPRDVRRDAAPTSPGAHPPQESSCPHPGFHVCRPHERRLRHGRGTRRRAHIPQRLFVLCGLGARGSLARPEAPASWRCSC